MPNLTFDNKNESMTYKKWLFIALTFVMVSVWLLNHAEPKIATKANQKIFASEPIVESPLSDDVLFPSPVIQLQQTIVHGLIEADSQHLPLLRGELSSFSQKNIKKQYAAPAELKELQSRLLKLQSLSSP